MSTHYLDFEKPLADLQTKIDGLKLSASADGGDVSDEVKRLEQKKSKLQTSIYASLSPWQVTQVARHPERPYSMDYIERIFHGFDELHGDRMFSDDQAIIGGLARIKNIPVMIIGHQKGRTTQEKVRRNFGMPRPEGYRKAQRLMKLAEKFNIPVVTLIDTPGAYPGIDAENRGQSEAIARSLYVMAELKVPIISAVIGEGGSGGALAIGVCDRLIMLSNSVYSVISPEGCASILWKDSEKAPDAAEAMGLTTDRLLKNKLVDEVVEEPLGGAHTDYDTTSERLRDAIVKALEELMPVPKTTLINQRHHRLRSYARFEE